tara:strand:+ start:136 stop:297 length:162 start_codon:yes stop_codon:yes gene_type:complete
MAALSHDERMAALTLAEVYPHYVSKGRSAAPWRRTAEEWINSMERLVELVPLD